MGQLSLHQIMILHNIIIIVVKMRTSIMMKRRKNRNIRFQVTLPTTGSSLINRKINLITIFGHLKLWDFKWESKRDSK